MRAKKFVSSQFEMKVVGTILLFGIGCDVFATPTTQGQDCGRRKGIGANIVRGNKTTRNEWPWLVAFVKLPEEIFFCGGSLVSATIVLSGKRQ